MMKATSHLPDQERYRVSPVGAVPASREVSTTRYPNDSEWQSRILRSGRKDSRPKLTTRNPDLIKSSSMSNIMATAKKPSMRNIMVVPLAKKSPSQRSLHDVSGSKLLRRSSTNGQASSARDVMASPTKSQRSPHDVSGSKLLRRSSNNGQASSARDVMVSPATSQRRIHDVSGSKLLRRSSNNGRASSTRDVMASPAASQRSPHDVSGSKLLRRSSNNGRASSARDVMASPRNPMTHRSPVMEKKQTVERTLPRVSRQSPESKCVVNAHISPKQRVKLGTKVRLQGFLEDDNRNRVKSDIVEAADATSTKAISGLSVHTRKVPTTAHATRRPCVMPSKASSQRSIVQNRKSGPRSSNVALTPSRPSYQTSKSEGVLRGMPFCPFPPATAAIKKRPSKKENETLHSDSTECTWECDSFASNDSFFQ
jgi:hypothetical protein